MATLPLSRGLESVLLPCNVLTTVSLTHGGAGNQVRTGDLDLGKVALYQLSYSRTEYESWTNYCRTKRLTEQKTIDVLERETRFELATSTLARSRSTN